MKSYKWRVIGSNNEELQVKSDGIYGRWIMIMVDEVRWI